MMEYFQDMAVSVTPIVVTQEPDASGDWADTETEGTAIQGIKFNRSDASRYFSTTWAQDVTAILVVDDITGIEGSSKVRIGTVTYEAQPPIDPGMNNLSGWDNVYTVGLKVTK